MTATIVDLAVRGCLRIEEIPAEGTGTKSRPSWRLIKLADAPVQGDRELLAYEQLIIDRLFASGDEVDLADLGASFTGALGETQTKLYEAVTERGWFTANPAGVRHRWYGIGIGLVLVGIAAAIVLALTLGWGLVGLAVVVVGVVAVVLTRAMPARTADGTAVLAQTLASRPTSRPPRPAS